MNVPIEYKSVIVRVSWLIINGRINSGTYGHYKKMCYSALNARVQLHKLLRSKETMLAICQDYLCKHCINMLPR